jgi:chemosensory pili system protein ChpA (sensor histidine kinase/response regulator)
MARTVDKEVLVGFIEEAQSYLPAILQGIETFRADPTKLGGLEEAHRHAHTIKGAASMVGLSGLSHIAYHVEEALEEIGAGQLAMDDETSALLRKTITQIEGYLDGVLSGTLRERPLVAEVIRAYRRLRGLPAEEDEAAVEEVLAEITDIPVFAPGGEERQRAEVEVRDLEPEAVPIPHPGHFVGMPTYHEEVSPELLEAFSLEAEDHLRNIGTLLADLDKQPEQIELLQDVRRSVHTLKGSAGTVGLQAIAQLAHRMEDLLDQLYDGGLAIDSGVMGLLFASADALEDLAGGAEYPKGEVEAEAVQSTVQDLYTRYSALLGPMPSAEKLARRIEPLGEEMVIDLAELAPHLEEQVKALPGKVTVPRIPSEVVRVPLERLDELIRLVSELVITRTTFEQRMSDLVDEAEELRPSIDRLRRISFELETRYEVSALGGRLALPVVGGPTVPHKAIFNTHGFDALEFDRYTEFHRLLRELAETTSDVNVVGNDLDTLIGDFDSILNRQRRLSSEIQEKLMRVRMVPLATLATRLHRAVRTVAREQGKLVDLVLEGEDIELDKTVLEEIADPLLHLLRNAVDHGIEPPALRQVMGKPERGLIRLRAYYEGNQVVIQVGDDGAGLEPQILRSKAVSGGYVSESDAPQLSDEELHSLVFLPGFSTAGEVSEVSGRGVGLDIVKTNVHKLKGSVTLDSTPGSGMTFTIRLPMTLAVTRALLISAHNETFAIPLDVVRQILRLEREEVERVGQEPVVRVGGQVYPMLRLGEVLNLKQPADESVQRLPALVLNAGGKQVALVVDHILEGREIVIKTLGNHLRQVHGVTGATLMGDGSVVLILNPADLVSGPAPEVERTWTPLRPLRAGARVALSVMVVDDSVSVRRVVSNLIKSVGWQPVAARDGLEALEIIQRSAQPPDLILLDIEMPRMDGYELMATLKGQEAYQNIPIVILTSRAAEKHRRKALELGASEYVVKPYQDEALINLIRQLVRESHAEVSSGQAEAPPGKETVIA